jgi:single-stranded DNA-specific DHH superfamily exonuclease
MPITEKELKTFKKALDESARPLFFFDDDADGVTSFVQLYKYKKEGKGVAVKASPILDAKYIRKVEEYDPDLIIILDKPMVDEEFFDKVKTPILWLDHHKPFNVKQWKHVRYFNPRLHDDEDNLPTTYWIYKIVGGPLWLATLGAVADWHVPDYLGDFAEKYGSLLPPGYSCVEDLLFNKKSQLGTLVRIINFNLKGTVQETMKSVLVLTRIDSPEEILEQTTPRGKYLYKKYERLASKYEALKKRAIAAFEEGSKILHFTYSDDMLSLTSDLSNELLYLYPEHLVMIARMHGGEYKYSLRSAGKYEIPPILDKALEGLEGYGGGHTYACGAAIKEAQQPLFLERIAEALEKL